MVLFPGEANHMRPLGSLLSSPIPFRTAGGGYSVIFPVAGSRRPTGSIIPEAYQTFSLASRPTRYKHPPLKLVFAFDFDVRPNYGQHLFRDLNSRYPLG